jgi:hypothetical protein
MAALRSIAISLAALRSLPHGRAALDLCLVGCAALIA